MAKKRAAIPHLPVKCAYDFLRREGYRRQADEIKKAKVRVGEKTSSIRRGLVVDFLVKKELLEAFATECWRIPAKWRMRKIVDYLVLVGRCQEKTGRRIRIR